MQDINEGIFTKIFGKKDPVTGKRYYGKKVGDDQADPNAEPSKGFSVGGVDPKSNKPFLGVQPGRDPSNTLTGKLSRAFIPRLDKETGRLYMGDRVGDDQAGAKAVPTSSSGDVATPSSASAKPSSFGAAFKAARQARLSGKGGDTFEYNGKQYHSYQKGESRSRSATPSATPAAARPAATAAPEAAAKQATAAIAAASAAKATTSDAEARSADRVVDSRGVIQPSDGSRRRFRDDPSKVFTQTTRDPGENSVTTTRSGGTTSTVSVSGGGSTEHRLVDNRTAAEKASDDARDEDESKKRLEASQAAAFARYGERMGYKNSSKGGVSNSRAVSVKENVESYKNAFRSVLSEGVVVPFRRNNQNNANQTRQQSQASAAKPTPKFDPWIIAKYARRTPGLAAGIGVGMSDIPGQAAKTAISYYTDVETDRKQNKDLKVAALDRGVPLAANWAAGDVTQSLVDRGVNKLTGVKNPPITPKGVGKGLGGTALRAGVPAAAETLASYLETKAEKNPNIATAVKRATPIIRGVGYGYGIAGGPGAAVGGLGGMIKSGSEGMSSAYKDEMTDQERQNMRSRGIARFGFNPYERLDAEVAAEKKKKEVAARSVQQKPGNGTKPPGA